LKYLKLLILIGIGTTYSYSTFGQYKVNFKADERLFTVYSLLNICGFDTEYGKSMSEVRLGIREDLKNIDPQLLNDLKNFYKDHNDWYDYVCYSFIVNSPPTFTIDEKYQNNELIKSFDEFPFLLKRFYKECRIDSLWNKYKLKYENEIELHEEELKDYVPLMWNYLKIPDKKRFSIDKVLVVPNLLGSHLWATQFEDTIIDKLYVVSGPYSLNAPIAGTVIHEMMHSITGPLLKKHEALIDKFGTLNQIVRDKPTIKENYNSDFHLVLEESLVRALTWKIVYGKVDTKYLHGNIQREYKDGFILIWHFYEALGEFEKNNYSILEYYRTLISNIDIDKEEQRWKESEKK